MNAPVETVTLRIGDATVIVPGELAAMAYLEKLLDESRPMRLLPPAARPALPPIGAEWHGGKYAGLTVHEEDPHELVLLPGEFEGPWEKAKAWAAEQGGVLPSRIDQNVLFKNLKSEFNEAWYWSSEPYAGAAGYAWFQGFGYGGQYYDRISSTSRARAVRRLVIQ